MNEEKEKMTPDKLPEQRHMEEVNVIPEKSRANQNIDLLSLIEAYNRGEIQNPPFQRNFVWEENQVDGWIESVEASEAIGVIVTYQLKGGGVSYLADGLQRITATSRYLQNPNHYKRNYSIDQARIYCRAFLTTLQHRIYGSHKEAMQAFQRLNQGTSLTPFEFHAGILRLRGEVGEKIIEEIPDLVMAMVLPYIGTRSINRESLHKLKRDGLGQFLQYVSGYKLKQFWNVSTSKVYKKGPVVEEELSGHTQSWSVMKYEQEKKKFAKHLEAILAEIETAREQTGTEKLRISRTAMRYLLHLGTWRKNNNAPVNSFTHFLRALFQRYENEKHISSAFKFMDRDLITLGLDSLGSFNKLCEFLGSDLNAGRERRRKKKNVRPGYNESHELPFSKHGDGETIIEPAMTNLARGARPIKKNNGEHKEEK